MAFTDLERLWVIFDTCTKREYYQDVHNLLALPTGAVIRYDYREDHLSNASLTEARNGQGPATVLHIYGQWDQYTRGSGSPKDVIFEPESMRWLAVRVATMRYIGTKAETFLFDLEVREYPRADQESLMSIVSPLIAAGEVPYKKWVAISEERSAFRGLCKGGHTPNEQAANWQAIVDTLGTSPFQFVGDSFWRLEGPFATTKASRPVRRELRDAVADAASRRVDALYPLVERQSYTFYIESYNPKDAERAGKKLPARTVDLEVRESDPIAIQSQSSVVLRPYSEETVTLYAKPSEDVAAREGTVLFTTSQAGADWPVGPSVTLRFLVSRNRPQIAIGVALAFAAAMAGVATASTDGWQPYLYASLGLASSALAAFALTGKIKLP